MSYLCENRLEEKKLLALIDWVRTTATLGERGLVSLHTSYHLSGAWSSKRIHELDHASHTKRMTPIILLLVCQLTTKGSGSYSVSPSKHLHSAKSATKKRRQSLPLCSSIPPLCLEKPSAFHYMAPAYYFAFLPPGSIASDWPCDVCSQSSVFVQLWLRFSLCPTCCFIVHFLRLNRIFYSEMNILTIFNNTLCLQADLWV